MSIDDELASLLSDAESYESDKARFDSFYERLDNGLREHGVQLYVAVDDLYAEELQRAYLRERTAELVDEMLTTDEGRQRYAQGDYHGDIEFQAAMELLRERDFQIRVMDGMINILDQSEPEVTATENQLDTYIEIEHAKKLLQAHLIVEKDYGFDHPWQKLVSNILPGDDLDPNSPEFIEYVATATIWSNHLADVREEEFQVRGYLLGLFPERSSSEEDDRMVVFGLAEMQFQIKMIEHRESDNIAAEREAYIRACAPNFGFDDAMIQVVVNFYVTRGTKSN